MNKPNPKNPGLFQRIAGGKKKEGPSTQAYLNIEEIHDGIVILKNGGMRTAMLVSTVNFALKSEEEQNVTIYGFQNFLNALSFPVQVVMQSRRLDLSAYIGKLKEIEKTQPNQLLRMQTTDYIDFIEKLLQVANIMDKKFFVVVPFEPVGIKKAGIFEKIMTAITGRPSKREILEFERNKKEILQRTEIIAQSLGSMGLRAVQLSTLELAELYYGSYNPEASLSQKITSVEQWSSPTSNGNQ